MGLEIGVTSDQTPEPLLPSYTPLCGRHRGLPCPQLSKGLRVQAAWGTSCLAEAGFLGVGTWQIFVRRQTFPN